MKLNNLQAQEGGKIGQKATRRGRGIGSGLGKTSGRGTKGQKSRSGGGVRPGFEGGQMPLFRRLPKRGFKNIFRKEYATVNISSLNIFDDGETVDTQKLIDRGLVRKNLAVNGVKVLGNGELEKKINLNVERISESAKEKVEAKGGKVEVK
ncbi:50S ribosomal protein L15 [Fenollaria sporofastidiosus]|uniref:50S ribosomal protein L15 n=1 Tax=Fenollaria sporofastidiosus TaxID=2811778 RepID=UPI001C002046|nr:50S ribosomal protein L15 [Fenollaria sporofastidiosus]